MSDQLRDDPDALGVLCAQAAEWFTDKRGTNVPALVLEKDFWVTEVLRAVAIPETYERTSKANCDVTSRAVFKGGTSLSKAFGIIERFSEDADVYLDITLAHSEDVGKGYPVGNGRIDTIMKMTAARIGEAIGVTPEKAGISRSGTKRGFVYKYAGAEASTASGYKEGVLLELVHMGTPTPNAPHTIGSLLAEYVTATGRAGTDEYEELAPFQIDVLCAERTLVDKLSILHGVATDLVDNGPDASTHRFAYQTRHYYDVHRLLSNPAVLQSVEAQSGLVETYGHDAYSESLAARKPATARPDDGYASSPAFTDSRVLDIARVEYEAEMPRLSLGDVPTFDEIVATVQNAAAHL